MHFRGERFDALAEFPGQFRKGGILAHQFQELRRLLRGDQLPLFAGHGQRFAVLGIGIGVGFVAIGLAGLREQDQRCGVGRLEAESEVEEDERINIEMEEPGDIDDDPDGHDHSLRHEEERRPEKPRESLGFQGKPIVSKHLSEVQVRGVEAEMMFPGGCGDAGLGWRDSGCMRSGLAGRGWKVEIRLRGPWRSKAVCTHVRDARVKGATDEIFTCAQRVTRGWCNSERQIGSTGRSWWHRACLPILSQI
jgi:hypothetical protein